VVPNPKALVTLAKAQGKENLSHEAMCRDPLIVAAVAKAIHDHARKAKLNKMESPTKILVVAEEWSPDSGLVTAAMKIRRRNIQDFYKMDINRLYGIESGDQSKST
jgi:long-chain acyl-CoA synthetase